MDSELKPFLKWSGSKQAVADAIRRRFPVQFSGYYEPLIGGGSVFLGGSRIGVGREEIGDVNGWLVDTYRALRDSCDRVVEILGSMVPSRMVYSRIRESHPSHLGPEYRAAHLIYLNQLCFGNMFRLNQRGYFNVPFFATGLAAVFDPDHLRRVRDRLQGVGIEAGDFAERVAPAQAGDFVYFDPPSLRDSADGTSRDPFGFYGFRDQDYLRLASLCRDLDQRGVHWAVSDSNTSLMRIYFSRYHRIPLVRDPFDREIKSLLYTNYVAPDEHEPDALPPPEVLC